MAYYAGPPAKTSTISPEPCGDEEIDTHDYFTRQIRKGGDGIVGASVVQAGPGAPSSTGSQAASYVPSEAVGFEDQYFLLESISGVRDEGKITFIVSEFTNAQSIVGCVQMTMSPFYFPRVKAATGTPDKFFFKRVYIAVTQFSNMQSIRTKSNTFHWECEVEMSNSNAVLLRPIDPVFRFTRPLNLLDSLEFSFMIPGPDRGIRALRIPADRMRIQMNDPGTNPVVFTVIGLGEMSDIGVDGAQPSPGTAVWISGLLTGDATIDSTLNGADGVFITSINYATRDLTFAGIDASALSAPYEADMYIGNNRIAIPFKTKTVRTSTTNMISAVSN